MFWDQRTTSSVLVYRVESGACERDTSRHETNRAIAESHGVGSPKDWKSRVVGAVHQPGGRAVHAVRGRCWQPTCH